MYELVNIDELINCIYRKEENICTIHARKVKCVFFIKGGLQNYCDVVNILKEIKRRNDMVILDNNKKIEDLNKEEKLKYEIMRTLAISKGMDINSNVQVDFTSGSNFYRAATVLLKKFDISLKGEKYKKEFSSKNLGIPFEEKDDMDYEAEKIDSEETKEDSLETKEKKKSKKSKSNKKKK